MTHRFASLGMAVLVVLLAVSPALAASIQTDLWVYAQGDTVTVTGDGFGTVESVDIVTTDPYGAEVDRGIVGTDSAGSLRYDFVLSSAVPGIYDVVATGEQSGITASTQFDPPPVPPSSLTATDNRPSGDIVLSWTGVNSSTDCYLVYRATSSLPAQAAATGDFVCGSPRGQYATVSVPTTSFTDTAVVAGQTYFYYVTALKQGNKQGESASSNQVTVAASDTTPPTVSMTSAASNPTKISPIPVTVSFSESVTGFTSSDITATNGTVGSFSGSGASYSFNLTPSGQGTVSADIAAGVAQDAAGNANTAAATFSRTYDSLPPTVSMTSAASNPSGASPIPVTVSFSESVSGFTATDVTATNGTVGSFSGSGASYSFNLTPSGQGTVSADIAAGVAQDAAGNANTAAATFSRTYDSQAPNAPAITSPANNSYNTTGDVTVSGTAEPNSTVELFDGTTSKGTTTANGSGDWSNALTRVADGSHTYTTKATDAAGNTSAASNSRTVIVDTQAPTDVTVSADRPADHNAWYNHAFTATWTGEDATSGIDHCTVTPYSGPDDASGSIVGTCTDKAGNTSAAINFTFKFDATAPTDVSGAADRDPDHNSWYNHLVGVNFSGTDATSGIDSCTETAYSGPDSAEASVSGTCTDEADNTSASVASGLMYDDTAPSASLSVTAGTAGSNGWNTSDVTVHTGGSDSVSGIETCTIDQRQTTETAGQAFNGSCTNGAGLTTNADSLTIKLDKTGPSAALSVTSGVLGTNGWYTSKVTVSTTGSDSISSPVACTADQSQTTDTTGTSFNGSCTNDAGLTTNATALAVKLDKTGPSAQLGVTAGTAGSNGWYTSDVTVSTTGSDSISSPVTCSGDQSQTTETAGHIFNGSCTNDAGLTAHADSLTIKLDKTGPSAALSVTSGVLGTNGWYTSDVTIHTSGADAISDIASCTADQSQTTDSIETSFNGSCTNDAGLTTNASALTLKRDATPPTVPTFVGGPDDGAAYYYGSVPAAPTCSSSDATSGLAGCRVTGYEATVGAHTLTATALDNAGNVATATRAYTVLAWTMKGFYQPVDMSGTGGPLVWNTVKGGSTVPLKFEIFSGSTELTDVSAVQSFMVKQTSCTTSTNEDAIELTTTGGTVLRYDGTAGQFIQNWQTPKQPGKCYSVTMTALDNSTISAWFKLK